MSWPAARTPTKVSAPSVEGDPSQLESDGAAGART